MKMNLQERGKSPVLAFAGTAKCDYSLKIEVEPDVAWNSLKGMDQELSDLDRYYPIDSDNQKHADLNGVEEPAKTEFDESTEDDSDDSDNQKFPDFNKMDELAKTGDEDVHDNLAYDDMDGSACKDKLCHISSIILKAKSQYFFRLFKNADQSSQEKVVSLRIKASEVPAFLRLLEFMHGTATPGTLKTSELAHVLMVAEKFEVKSCLNECIAELKYRCRTLRNTLLRMPLAAVEVVLSSDSLEVELEDHVFKFVLKWIASNYETLDQRVEILNSRLAPVVRYQYLSANFIEELKRRFQFEYASKFISEALDRALKYKKSSPDWESGATGMTTNKKVAERAYKCKPVKVVMHQQQHKTCTTIYLSFTQDECVRLSRSPPVHSERFHFDGGSFVVTAARALINACWCFGLSVKIERAPSGDDYICMASVRSKKNDPSVLNLTHVWSLYGSSGKPEVYEDLFSVPWDKFMEADSPWFVDGMLDLVVEISAIVMPVISIRRSTLQMLMS